MELLRWAAKEEGRYIVEDDYDSEYRYKGKPIIEMPLVIPFLEKSLHDHLSEGWSFEGGRQRKRAGIS